jgi:predicted RNA-binding Zn-ribbon protein involved in translation (DUF1610 family)
MRALRTSPSSRLSRKLCLACGYDGPALQGVRAETAYMCPNCGEDLYARPPRSYAELEGLDDELVFARSIEACGGSRPRETLGARMLRLVRRWLRAMR